MLRLLLLAALAFAQEPESYWVELPPEGATGEGNTSAPDKVEFWDKLQEKAFDEFCKLVEIPLSYRFNPLEQIGLTAKYKRGLKRLPTGNLAVVDEAKLGLNLHYFQPLAEAAEITFGAGIYTRLEGESFVVRPLPSKKSCHEVDTVLKIWDAKTVLPLTGERLSEMMVGELWRLPMTLTVGGALSAGRELTEALPVSISVSANAQGRASVSLFRISESQVRFRLRLDQATIRDASGNIIANFATTQLGMPSTENILMKLLAKEAAQQFNRYAALTLNVSRNTRQGINNVLEFVLDPRDPEQMEALSKALRGELGVLKELERLARLAKDRMTSESNLRGDLGALYMKFENELQREATFAGADQYKRQHDGFRIKLPILFNFGRHSQKDHDHIVLLDENGGEFDIHRTDKHRDRGFLDIPLLGQAHKFQRDRSARVFTYKDARGRVDEPMAVYVEQTGFYRAGAGSVFGLAHRADEMMQLVGTRGMGRNPRGRLPLDKVVPPPDSPGGWKRGASALTISLNQKAIQDAINASVETVLRSVANLRDGTIARMVDWVVKNGRVDGDDFEYDSYRMAEAFGLTWHNDEDRRNYIAQVYFAVKEGMEIVRDLAKVRLAATPEARAAEFLKVMTGDSESGLDYEDIMQVLLQLVDPTDVSAEFFTQIAGKKDIRARLVLHGNKQQDPRLEAMARARARFAEPSFLAD